MQFCIIEFSTYKINPCIDSEIFKFLDDSVDLKYYVLAGKIVILTVARLEERKDIDMVIKALPEVISSYMI